MHRQGCSHKPWIVSGHKPFLVAEQALGDATALKATFTRATGGVRCPSMAPWKRPSCDVSTVTAFPATVKGLAEKETMSTTPTQRMGFSWCQDELLHGPRTRPAHKTLCVDACEGHSRDSLGRCHQRHFLILCAICRASFNS